MERFTRSSARVFRDQLQIELNTLGKKFGMELTLGSGTFTEASLKLKLECRLKEANGEVSVADLEHSRADSFAERNGLSFTGHIIGSVWRVKEDYYKVISYESKNRSYPFINVDVEGERRKAGTNFFKAGVQIAYPDEPSFLTYCSIDPDEDSVRESDVQIYDDVNAYYTLTLDPEELQALFDTLDYIERRTADTKVYYKLVWHSLMGNELPSNIKKQIQRNL